MKKIRILGISAFFHDSSVTLLENGKILYASQEERFTRVKNDSSFPSHALRNLLKSNNLDLKKIDFVVFFEKPFLKFERLIETYLAFAPKGLKQFIYSMPIWLKEKLFMKREILRNLKDIDKNIDERKIYFSEHHLSHAASAFFPSPFEKAIIFTADGVGEWTTTSVAIGEKNKIQMHKEINFPNSLGLLYSAFTYFIGFKVNSGEYKLMGLAPFGEPKYANIIEKELIDIKNDGSFTLNQKYFNFATGFTMINSKFSKLFDNPPRKPETEIKQFHMDIASSIQKVTEKVLLLILSYSKKELKINNLCFAGGVALNCVANGLIRKQKIFKNIWIQPASGDAGGSLGAALALWHIHLKKKRIINQEDNMSGSFLGPKYDDKKIENDLKHLGANYKKFKKNEMLRYTAKKISEGKAVGWFQGRMEFGPRALGGRSIIADPRKKNIQKQLNLKIKFRESFRPFAPAILEEYTRKWFDLDCKSPYMLFVANVNEEILIEKKINNKNRNKLYLINDVRSKIPGVTHVDNSARIQTVGKKNNPKFYQLIKEFYRITKTPIVINTSFNIRGEPIVCSPRHAFRCFMGTNLDLLVIENFVLEKCDQNKNLLVDHKNEFKLD